MRFLIAFLHSVFNQALASENAPYSGAFTQTKEINRKSKRKAKTHFKIARVNPPLRREKVL